ncbi:exopolysaccharide biosynthesis protein [Marinobacter lacisalsi]|uniref:Exopolysaccharide biosynthesis protein n=1 Tax=Marinobacter lacisalsi TaxID=475979 RepID=A0ABV8QBX5_9GAMM
MSDPANLQQVLDRISQSAVRDRQVTFGDVIDTVGSRSFGPVLMTIGILLLSPISGIPGVPTLSGLLILFIAVQILVLQEGFWLPAWIMERHLPSDKLLKGIRFLEPAATFIDARLHPRLVLVVRGPGSYLLGGICVAIACAMPLMEIIPFSATAAGFALAVFGLAMISLDGLLALLGMLFTGSVATMILVNVL